MAEQEQTQQERTAIDLVVRQLSPPPPPDLEWTVLPFRDALLVCPVTRARGGSIYLVRQGEVRPVLSSRVQTEDEVYEELVAQQGG